MSKRNPMTRYGYYRTTKEHEANERFEEALATYDKAIELSESYAHVWFNKNRSLYRMRNMWNALVVQRKHDSWNPFGVIISRI